jgi:hypothetical protein
MCAQAVALGVWARAAAEARAADFERSLADVLSGAASERQRAENGERELARARGAEVRATARGTGRALGA